MHLKSGQGEKGTIGSMKSGWDIIYQASINEYTRNMHAHLCLAPVRRLCARASYAGSGEARVARVTFAVGEASWLVFVVSKPRDGPAEPSSPTSISIAKERRRPRSI